MLKFKIETINNVKKKMHFNKIPYTVQRKIFFMILFIYIGYIEANNEKNASSFWSQRLRQLTFKLTYEPPLTPLSWRSFR